LNLDEQLKGGDIISFLEGFIASSIDEQGNSDVVRIDIPSHKEMVYSIDSETVEDLRIFQGSKELKLTTEIIGGKTLVNFFVKPGKWFGMMYRRAGFTNIDNGVWDYRDHWYIPFGSLFMLTLPAYAIILSLNAEGLKENQFDLENHLVMSQRFSGGDLHIKLKYAIDSQKFLASRPPTLEKSSFPHQPLLFLPHDQSGLSSVRKVFTRSMNAVDWIAKGAVIIKALEILDFI
jgi:hypothetical protein